MIKKFVAILRIYGLTELLLILVERKMKLRLPISSKMRWKFNISSEIRFWDNCVRTNGLIWPNEYILRLNPALELQEEIAKLLPKKEMVTILDVGAGPLTYLGKVHKEIKFNIIAVDPLADEYGKILTKYRVVPLVRTQKLDAEELTKKFDANNFDLVFARNCIDHSYSPENAILEMLKVVKRESSVLLLHRPNEAEQENWQGLHQWNFSSENGDFIVSSKKTKLNFTKKYSNLCVTECRYDAKDDMLYIRLLKK